MIYITAIDFKMLVSFIFVIGVLQHPNTNKTLPIRNKMAAQKQNSQTNQKQNGQSETIQSISDK